MKKWKSLFAPACMGLLLLFSCDARERDGYAGYDTADWQEWDGDTDERLSADEFRTPYEESGYFNRWDTNQDQGVDAQEWDVALNSHMGPEYDEGQYGSFNDWDADADGVLNDRELGDGVFAYYDTNRDSYLEEEEFGVWSGSLDYQKTERPN